MVGIHPIKAWRQSQEPRLSVAGAAIMLGVSKAAVSRWENGERQIDQSKVRDIARRTGIDPRALRPDWVETLEAAE